MKVVFVSSEIVPFASTGGLGDVAAALPKALAVQGVEIFRIMPLYQQIDRRRFRLTRCEQRINVPLGPHWYQGEIWMQEFEGVTTFYIQHTDFFDRDGLYGVEGGQGYDDNFERFLYFQKAAVQLMDLFELEADVVHCNDWQTALVPMFLHYGMDGRGREMKERSLYTIHNLAYQGWAPKHLFELTGLPWECYTMHTLEYYGEINCMKGGLVASTAINTVSPRYAQEIQTVEFGSGLHEVLQIRKEALFGILNGIDYQRWNPEIDPHIVRTYSVDDLSGKARCKQFLQEQAKFPVDPDIPLMGMISRLAPQKGIDLLLATMDRIVTSGAQLLILGSGDTPYEEALRNWAERVPDSVCAWIEFSSGKAHQIEAGSDLFLMPSAFEPCGQNQLFSMRYGTLPLVHAVGGLSDTVTDAAEPEGNGFKFHAFTPDSFAQCIQRAIELYRDQVAWKKLICTAMRADFSDRKMADHYMALYAQLLAQPQGRMVDGRMVTS